MFHKRLPLNIGIKIVIVAVLYLLLFPHSTSAQTSCSYYAQTQVRLHSATGPIVSIKNNGIENFGASNNKQYEQDNKIPNGFFGTELINGVRSPLIGLIADYAQFTYFTDNFVFNSSGYFNGEKAWVKLMGLNTDKYEIIGKYCTGFGCPSDIASQSPNDTIENFIIQCNMEVQYGWIVREKAVPTMTPIPTRVPTARIAKCYQTCLSAGFMCQTGLICHNTKPGVPGSDVCRNPLCPTNKNCICTTPTNTPTPTTVRPTVTPPTCSEGKRDIRNNCDPACCRSDSDCTKPGETCYILNGGCKYGKSCGVKPSPTQPPITDDCLVYHRGSKSKMGVVIIAEKGFNNQEFLNHVRRQVSDFTNTNLKDQGVLDYLTISALNPDKFKGPECNHSECKDLLITDLLKGRTITKAKRVCNSKYFVFFSKKNGRSYALPNSHSVIFRNDLFLIKNVFPHEIGHVIPLLNDEYTEAGKTPFNLNGNCTTTSSSSDTIVCPVWESRYPKSKYPDMGCYRGCLNNFYNRPTYNSLMRNQWLTNEYNPPSLDMWRKALGLGMMTAFQQTSIPSEPYNNLTVEISVNSNNPIITSVKHESGYPLQEPNPNAYAEINNNYYVLDLKNSDGTILHKQYEWFKTFMMSDDFNKDNPQGGQEEIVLDSITSNLPYFVDAVSLTLSKSDGIEIKTYLLSDFNVAPAQTFTQLCGNGVCDANIGENEMSCALDCTPLTIPDSPPQCQSGDINKDGVVNTIDAIKLLKLGADNRTDYEADLNCDNQINALDTSFLHAEFGSEIVL